MMDTNNLLTDTILKWLLEKNDPGVRYLAVRDLALYDSNAELSEVQEAAHTKGPIGKILDRMKPEGWWAKPGAGYFAKYKGTPWALILLAQLGADIRLDSRISTACEYLLEHALTPNGQFTIRGTPSTTIDCLQGNLCWALTALGCSDPRLEKAYEWMARSVTGEGVSPKTDKKAQLRYYAYQCGPTFACGPNKEMPCAWGGAKTLLAFGLLPKEARTPLISRAIEQGINFMLSIDPVTGAYPHGLGAKPSGNWWKFGFPVFYVTDILQIAEALTGLGLRNDPRLANTIELICSKRNEHGSWNLEYDYTGKTWRSYGKKSEPSKWVTIRALRVLLAH